MKKNTNIYFFILTLLLILVNIFRDKIIYIAPTLYASISIILYSITFLLVILIFKKYNRKEAKEGIILSALFLLLFYIMTSLICSFSSTIDSNIINENLRNVFTPNYISFYNITIYYPDLLPLITTTVIYIFSHYVCITIYEILEDNSNYFIAFLLSILISFIIDQMLCLPIINIVEMYYNRLNFIGLIKILTGNFFIVITSSIIMLFIYPFCLNKKERKY